MKVKSGSEVAQSSLTCSDPMDCSLPGSSIRGILQARVLEWGAIAFSIMCSRNLFFKLALPYEGFHLQENIYFYIGKISSILLHNIALRMALGTFAIKSF